MTSIITTTEFDYSQIADTKLADIMRNAAEEINALRTHIESDFLKIGEHLNTTKEQLQHGQFQSWVEQACGFSIRSATMLMRVAREYGDQIGNGCRFGVSILDQLAAAPDPQAALAEAEALAADGVPVTKAVAADIRAEVASAPEIAATPDPSTDSDLDTVLAAFATGIPIKSLHMIKHLTGIQDEVRLLSALNLLVVTGELRAAGMTTYQRIDPAPVVEEEPESEQEVTLEPDDLDIGVLGSRLYNWLKEQGEPQTVLGMNLAVDGKTRFADVMRAIDHMIGLGWMEESPSTRGPQLYRAVTLEDHRERNPDPWKPSEGDQVPAEPTQESIEPPRDIMLHITDAVREALAKWRTLPVYEPGFSVTLGWLAQETGYERDELIAACNLLVGEGTLWADPDDYGVCFLLEAPAVEDDPAPVQASAQETPAESPEALPGESDNNAEPSGDVQMLLNAAVRALRNHGAGMFYHELKQFMAGDNQRTNQALAFGVKSGVLVKDDRNYYTLPEFATRAKTEPIPPAPDSAKARLIMLVEAAKKAQQFAQDLEKFTAQDSWNDLDLDTLNEARSTISRAAGILSRSGKHLSEMYRPLSVAISHQESVYEGINGD